MVVAAVVEVAACDLKNSQTSGHWVHCCHTSTGMCHDVPAVEEGAVHRVHCCQAAWVAARRVVVEDLMVVVVHRVPPDLLDA